MVLKRLMKVAVPLAGVAAATYAYSKDEPDNFFPTVLAHVATGSPHTPRSFPSQSPPSSTSGSSSASPTSEADMFPRGSWDYNWDHRDPLSMINAEEFEKANEEGRKKLIEAATPSATRHIILIRHGQYFLDSDAKNLTPLGREQATAIGRRLAATGINWDHLIMSTMPRASETAKLMLAELPATLKTASDPLLEEGAPYPPEPPVAHWKPKSKLFFSEGARIEAAFRRYIHRASPKQKADSYEIIVCHANVIRYFVCRALQFPPEGWLRISLGNSSMTWLVIRPSGRVSLRSLGDVGHLPSPMITYG